MSHVARVAFGKMKGRELEGERASARGRAKKKVKRRKKS